MAVEWRAVAARCAVAWLVGVGLAVPGPAAMAQAPQPVPAVSLSARLALCNACHGADGVAPTPAFPSLAGQPKLFIENTLVLIREGLRDVPVMKDSVAGLSDEDIVALARHYAALPLVAKLPPARAEKVAAGAALSARLFCGSCHMPDYSGQQQVPRLAGQHEAYLLESMKTFRDKPGPGRDTIMAATLRGLSDVDLANLAHFLATFDAQKSR